MKDQQSVLPLRTDLTSRPERVAVKLAVLGLGLVERLMSRMAADLTPPADDPFYGVPENPEAFSPGELLDSRPVEVRGFRGLVDADAWQVKFRSTDTRGAAVPGVATVNLAVADVDRLVAAYRGEGVDVTYRRFRFGEHMIVMLAGVPGALRFLAERFDVAEKRRQRP